MATFVPYAFAAASAVSQGNAEKSAGDFNAAQKRLGAQVTLQQANQSEVAQRREAQLALGEQSAAMGEAGVSGSSTSAAVQHQSAVNAELDALNIRYRGILESRGLRIQAQQDQAQGRAAQNNSYLMAGGSLLKGRAQYY